MIFPHEGNFFSLASVGFMARARLYEENKRSDFDDVVGILVSKVQVLLKQRTLSANIVQFVPIFEIRECALRW